MYDDNMADPIRTILNLFARSPFKPLDEHAEKVKLTVLKMDEAVRAYVEEDKAKVEALYRQISELEHEADKVKHAIREHMPSSVLMPVDRADMLSYLKQQDDVANSAEMVAQLLEIKMVPMPRAVKDVLLKMDGEVLVTVEEHVAASNKIIEILDSSSVSKHMAEAQGLIDRVDSQKHNVDVTRLEAMQTVYAHEKELGPVGVYHLLAVIRDLGWVAEHAESASNRLRLMIAKR
ncbi:TIGR00153 family protein [Methanocella paludicola]|nr:TIGR00153 family protein [Methanocella paludicola]